MIVGTLCIKVAMRGSRSLKDKRRIVKSLKDRIRNKFNVSVSFKIQQIYFQIKLQGLDLEVKVMVRNF